MDLKRLDTLERSELEREARKIGVWAPHRKESAELIRRIRSHHSAPLRRAGRFLKKAANFALSLRDQALPPGRDERPKAPADPLPTAARAATVATPKPPDEAAPRRAAGPAAGVTKRLAPKKIIADADLVSEDDADQEPIPTRTMARLLAEQGHPRRALAIYRKLLREMPGDTTLEEEAAALESPRGRNARRTKAAAPADDDEGHAVGEVVFVRGPDGQLVVAWSLPKNAAERAQSILGPKGRPTARVVVVRASSQGGVLRETFDLQAADAEFEGEGSIPAPPGSRVTAAIGLMAGERFVSVAHAEPRRV